MESKKKTQREERNVEIDVSVSHALYIFHKRTGLLCAKDS
jgi:hypothetical protein